MASLAEGSLSTERKKVVADSFITAAAPYMMSLSGDHLPAALYITLSMNSTKRVRDITPSVCRRRP